MAVRQDKVQIIIEFLTDEAKALARTITQTDELKKNLAAAQKEAVEARSALLKIADGTDAHLKGLERIDIAEAKVVQHLNDIVAASQKAEKIDLTKVIPTQLVARANELNELLKFLPRNSEQAAVLRGELKRTNDALAEMRTETRGVGKAMDETRAEMTGFQHVLMTMIGFLGGLSLEHIIETIAEFGKELFERSKQIEVFGIKLQLVFGKSADDIERFATKMSEKVGQSTDEVIQDLTQMSNFFTTLEFSKNDIPQLTKQIYDVAAAWANFNAGEFSVLEVTEKLKSALGGELDNLAEVGIAITDDTLKKELQVRGYDKLIGKAYDQAAALTLIEIVTRKTQEAQNSFGSTQDTLHAKVNTTTAGLKNLRDFIAEKLSPVFSALLSPISIFFHNFTKGLQDVTPRMTALEAATEKEKNALVGTVEQTTKYAIGSKERAAAMDTILKIQPNFLAGLNKETASNEQLRAKMQEVNKEYQAKMIAIAASKEVEKALSSEREVMDSTVKSQARYGQGIVNARKFLSDYTSDVSVLQEKLLTTFRETSSLDILKRMKLQDLMNAIRHNEADDERLTGIYADRTKKAKENQQSVLDELKKQFPLIKQAFEDIDKAANGIDDPAHKIKIDMTIDPAELKKREAAALKAKIESIKGQHAIELVEAEKHHLLKRTKDFEFEEAKLKIDEKMYTDEIAAYKKYNKEESLEAQKAEAELLKIKIGHNDARILALKVMEEKKNYEIEKLITEGTKIRTGNTEGYQQAEYDSEVKHLIRLKALYFLAEQQKTAEALAIQNQLEALRERQRVKTEEVATLSLIKKVEVRQTVEGEASGAEVKDVNLQKEAFMEAHILRMGNQLQRALKVEQEYELKRLEMKEDSLGKQLIISQKEQARLVELQKTASVQQVQVLKEKGVELVDEQKKIELERLKTQKEVDLKRISLTEETENKRIEKLQLIGKTMGDVAQVASELLKNQNSEEKKAALQNALDRKNAAKLKVDGLIAEGKKETLAYKKAKKEQEIADAQYEVARVQAKSSAASAIKAFQIAEIMVNVYAEIAGIWKNANMNLLNSIIPGWGPVFAGVQTGIALGRAAAATQKINSQKFAVGGFTGNGSLAADETGERPVGVVHEGEWIAPRKMVEKNPKMFQHLDGLRLKGYATGGIAGLSITPRSDILVMPGTSGNSQSVSNADVERLTMLFEKYAEKVDNWQKEFVVKFVHSDFDEFKDNREATKKAANW
jgi:hypothetical protein